jgi:hypothetical protein
MCFGNYINQSMQYMPHRKPCTGTAHAATPCEVLMKAFTISYFSEKTFPTSASFHSSKTSGLKHVHHFDQTNKDVRCGSRAGLLGRNDQTRHRITAESSSKHKIVLFITSIQLQIVSSLDTSKKQTLATMCTSALATMQILQNLFGALSPSDIRIEVLVNFQTR